MTVENRTASSCTPRPVESASASTACQTNDSHFAYILTAGVLGTATLLVLGLLYVVIGVLSINWNSSTDTWGYTGDDAYRYEWDNGGAPFDEDWEEDLDNLFG